MGKINTPIHIKRIEKRLDDLFESRIDLSDRKDKTDTERRKGFLTRALAAYTLHSITGTDPVTAAKSVTDTYADNGIDAIFIDTSEHLVYLIQSKWREDGSKGIDQSEALKFMRGVGKLLQLEWDDFNDKVLRQKDALEAAVYDSNTKFIAVVAAPSNTLMSAEAQKAIDEKLAEMNGKIEPIVSLETYDLSRLYASLFETAGSSSIDLEITLSEWGRKVDPYLAYYGQIEVGDLMPWRVHGTTLFEKNLRNFVGPKSDVFISISATLATEPQHSWYFNNGATLLCKSLKKKPVYGENRDKGVFDCSGVCVVNGAQTIGSIWSAGRDGTALDPKSTIPIRIISLEKCPDGFLAQITRATNTQNKIASKDFAALDPNQQRLAIEMGLEGRRYVFRSGDQLPAGFEGCDINEAAACLASRISLDLAVKAKREVSLLWENIEKEPYTAIFNDRLTADYMWRVVTIGAAVEQELKKSATTPDIFRGKLIATHGNRLILHRVLKDPSMRKLDRDELSDLRMKAAQLALRELRRVASYMKANEPTGYPQMFFKSFERCKTMDTALAANPDEDPVPVETQLPLNEA